MKYMCPNCEFVFDDKVEKDKEYIPEDPNYINVDKTGATCWNCGYSSEFKEETWKVTKEVM